MPMLPVPILYALIALLQVNVLYSWQPISSIMCLWQQYDAGVPDNACK